MGTEGAEYQRNFCPLGCDNELLIKSSVNPLVGIIIGHCTIIHISKHMGCPRNDVYLDEKAVQYLLCKYSVLQGDGPK